MRRSLFIAFIILMLDAMGVGIILPVLPGLLEALGGTSISGAATIGGLLLAAYGLMQFLLGPLIGNLSDRFGRRLVLLISLVFLTLDYVLMAVSPNLFWLFLGRILAGAAGASYSVCLAVAADLSRETTRARNIGLVSAGFGVGFVLGPALGGLLADFGLRAPFWGAALLMAAALLLCLLGFKETLPPALRRRFELRRADPLRVFVCMARFKAVRGFLLAFFLFEMSEFVYPSVWAYFTSLRFDWSPRDIGLSLAFYGAVLAMVQGLLVQPFIRRYGETRTVYIGLIATASGTAAVGLALTSWQVYALSTITALGGLVHATLMGMASNRVSASEQGELQGVFAALLALVSLCAPLLYTQTFSLFVERLDREALSGAPFLLSGLIVILALLPLRWGLRTA